MAKQKHKQIAAIRCREARDLYNARRFQEALHVYANAIFLDPQDATSHKGKADTFYALERYKEACVSYEQSILLDKSYALAHEGLGNALYGLKKYKEARLAYEQAIKLKLDQNVYFSKWKRFITDGEEFYRSGLEAIQFDPSYERMYQAQITSLIEMGRTLHKQRKYKEALDLYEEAIQFHPGNAITHAEKGHALYALHHYSDALMAYTQAMALDPDYREIFTNKEAPLIHQAESFYEHRDYKQALAIYEQVIQFNPNNKNSRAAKMKVLNKLEQIAEEKRVAENMLRLSRNNSSWMYKEPFRYE